MSSKELLILRLLMDNPRGLFGAQFVHKSDGAIGRGTVYTLLERLVDKGMVREQVEPPSDELNLPRTRHFITAQGERAVLDFAQNHGLSINHGVLAT